MVDAAVESAASKACAERFFQRVKDALARAQEARNGERVEGNGRAMPVKGPDSSSIEAIDGLFYKPTVFSVGFNRMTVNEAIRFLMVPPNIQKRPHHFMGPPILTA